MEQSAAPALTGATLTAEGLAREVIPWGALAWAVLALWLVLFLLGTARAANVAGRSLWLFRRSTGRARLAAFGFRAGFALALAGPPLLHALPALASRDPLGLLSAAALPGLLLAATGATLALASQAAMGQSWRVGVSRGEIGSLVTSGPFRYSRNPVFLGQALLLTGVALALPSLATLGGLFLFLAAANLQIRDEERGLRQTHGAAYETWAAHVPRWIGPVRMPTMRGGGSGGS